MQVRISGTRGTVRRQLPLQAGRLGPPRRGKEWLSQYLPGRCRKESKNKWARAKTPDAKNQAPPGRGVWVWNCTSRDCTGKLGTRQNESIVHKCCQALKARRPQETGPSSLIQDIRKASGAQNHSRRRSSILPQRRQHGAAGQPFHDSCGSGPKFLAAAQQREPQARPVPAQQLHGLCTLRPGPPHGPKHRSSQPQVGQRWDLALDKSKQCPSGPFWRLHKQQPQRLLAAQPLLS